jgi:hypothetical protein
LKNLLCLGVLAVGLLSCLGCGESKPASTEAEAEKLNESPDYEKQMMGEMTGGAEKSNE